MHALESGNLKNYNAGVYNLDKQSSVSEIDDINFVRTLSHFVPVITSAAYPLLHRAAWGNIIRFEHPIELPRPPDACPDPAAGASSVNRVLIPPNGKLSS